MNRNKSIRNRIIRNFLALMCITIIVLNVLLSLYVKSYYYNNTEQILKNQISMSVAYYDKYFSLSSLEEKIYDNVDSFWDQSNAQVQVLDKDGNLLMDSIGVRDSNLSKYDDIKKAIEGESSRWVGKVEYYDYTVMAVSSPLEVNGEIVGIIRYITSMENIDNGIKIMVTSLIIISLAVLICAVIISIYLANEITNPIKSVTKVAEAMANGNMEVRSYSKVDNEIGKLSSTLNYMAEEIIKKDKLKNEFISSVSHELRTPLTSIKGWAITINQDTSDKDTVDLGVNIIEKEADRLTIMVEELLDFSRLVNGNITLRKTTVDLEELIRYTEHSFTPRAEIENKNFKVIDNLREREAIIDFDRIKQVLLNIIDNSFKFTEEHGSIEVIFKSTKENLYINIIDEGCGISKEDLPKVKEKFYKGKNSKSQNGIGLSICDEIIGLHKGSFNVQSEISKGTSIEIIIPMGGMK
ncbi:MAG: sensor histidine kinase [Clostridium sp.]